MDKINERIYEANIELVDRNKLLEKDVSILQKRIDKAIEYIDWQRRNPQYDNVWRNYECEDLIEILKGEEYGDNG